MIFNCLTAGQKLTEVHHRHEQLVVSPNLLKTKSLSEPKICQRFNKNTFSGKQPSSIKKNFSTYWIMNSIWSSNNSVFLQTEINNKTGTSLADFEQIIQKSWRKAEERNNTKLDTHDNMNIATEN